MVVVMPYQKVLRYRHGKLDTVLAPGKHRSYGFGYRYVRIDTRLQIIDVKPQEIPTADGIAVKVSAGIHLHVTDPIAHDQNAVDPESVVYDAAKSALRDIVRPLTLDEVTPGIAVSHIPDGVVRAATSVGYTVDRFEVRDVIVPAEIRRSNDELFASRQQSQIALEKARSEVAVLRALANNAKILEDHPALAGIRLVEAAGSYGATIIIDRPKV